MCDAVQILRAARQGLVDSAHGAVDIDDRVSHCLPLGGSQRLMYANAGTD
jgi:hypothetical protein